MRTIFIIGTAAYLALAVMGHRKERKGTLVCECRADCWCKRPGLDLVRWVFPFRHRNG